jgi:hypothetical protein
MRKLWAFIRRPGVAVDLFNGRGVRFNDADQAALEAELGTPGTTAAGTSAAGTEAAGSGTPKVEATPKTADDPEFDLEFGEEGKKEKKKVKLSDLHKGYMLNEDYTKKTQELSSERAKMKDLINWSESVKKNPEAVKLLVNLSKALETGDKDKISKAIGVFEAKVEAKKEATEEKIEDLEKELEGLDPDSNEYKFAARMLKMNQNLLKKLEDIEGKVNKTTSTVEETEKEKAKLAEKDAVERASKVLNDTLASLTDPKAGEVKLDSEKATGLWKKLVIAHLRNSPRDYKDENDFVETVKTIGKAVFAEMKEISEASLAKYIKSKESPIPHKPGGSGDVTPKDMTMDNLQGNIEAALNEELEKKK